VGEINNILSHFIDPAPAATYSQKTRKLMILNAENEDRDEVLFLIHYAMRGFPDKLDVSGILYV
jgi:hypothetical protein